jgi:FecR-like protein
MAPVHTRTHFILLMIAIGLTSAAAATGPSTEPIGLVVSVEGNVYHAVPNASKPRLLEPQDPVFAGDLLETQLRSRAKILLHEDTLITVAENSRIVLSSTHNDGEHGTQRTSVSLERGQARVLIGGPRGLHSTFEVQAGDGRIVAGYGYFTVWVHERPAFDADDAASQAHAAVIRSIGVANIGAMGEVLFSTSGRRESIRPGFFLDTELKTKERGPQPTRTSEPVQRLLVATEMREPPREDNPKDLLRGLPADGGKALASPGPIEAALAATGVIRALPANPHAPPP